MLFINLLHMYADRTGCLITVALKMVLFILRKTSALVTHLYHFSVVLFSNLVRSTKLF